MKTLAPIMLGLILIVTARSASAQMGPPTPAPELNKLDYFSGSWTIEATIGQGPWGNGGKFSATGTDEWMKGNFFLIGHSDFTLPAEFGGGGGAVVILGYDPDKKVYTEDRFDSHGQHQKSVGTLTGDTWTWTSQNNYNGMTIQGRLTLKLVSPTSYTTKYEVSPDAGATWIPFWDGKATKNSWK
jgi:Protein of unknown function (DUF1579)